MFYSLNETKTFNGKNDFIDITEYLQCFINTKTFGMKACFATNSADSGALLAVYFKESLLPDFSVGINKGYLTLTLRGKDRLNVFTGKTACNDGQRHTVQFDGDASGITLWLDGNKECVAGDITPYCSFAYVGFATIGRGVLVNKFSSYFEGTLFSMELAQSPFERPLRESKKEIIKTPLFCKGMCDSENYRIPTMLTLPNGTVIASADARKDAPGDNPNHICRAVRISKDSGNTWSEVRIVCDFGGYGRQNGAAAVDGQLLYDNDTNTVMMFFTHTPALIGSFQADAGNGFNQKGQKLLQGSDERLYAADKTGCIIDENGAPTQYTIDGYDRIYKNGDLVGSACYGEKRIFKVMNTTFLQVIESKDFGETWSEPRDLNHEVKAPWIRFMVAGPGNGLQIQEGPHKGRLVVPVYYNNNVGMVASSGAVYSDDHGASWRLGESVNDSRIFEGQAICSETVTDMRTCLGECQITELSGGQLKIFVRNTHYKRVIHALSDNGGESWHSFGTEPQLPDSGCQSHILRIKHQGKTAHLFSNAADESLRIKGTVRFSDDDTKTWAHSRLLECGEFGYSCMAQLPDGDIGILYEGLDITQYFAKLPIEWIIGEA